MSSKETEALRHRVDIREAYPAATPLFQNSAFESNSPYFYTRKANPNTVELEEVVAILEETKYGIAVSTGMAAIQSALNLLNPGDTLVVEKLIYGCSYQQFKRVAEKQNLKLIFCDLADSKELAALPNNVRMVFFETPTNPFLKTISVKKVRERFPSKDTLIVVDNTWATPLFQQPVKWGADISLHSATKYFSGHSDVMGGIMLVDRDDLHESLKQERFFSGNILDPHSSWLLRRSIQTLSVRLKEQVSKVKEMKDYLATLRWVEKVYFPEIDGEQLQDYPCILFFELKDPWKKRYTDFRDKLKLFGTGTGMACVTSMVAQPFSGSHASMSDADKAQMGITPALVRLCFGLESIEDLKSDLKAAFESLK